MTWYKTGTVAVTPGSNAVIGTGTSLIANSRVGDAFRGPDGEWYEVTNIASDTALSIAPDYQGAAVAAGVYSLAPMQGYVKDSADALRAATQVIASGVADMQEQVAAATEAAESAGQSSASATEQAGIASSAAQVSAENKVAAQQAAQQSGTFAQASGEAAVRAETARDSIIQSEQAAAASAAAAEDSADRAEEVTLGKAASGANNDITSLRAITSEGFDQLRQGIAPMVGATANTAGKKGLAPAGAAGDQDKFLTAGGVYKEAGGAGLPVGSLVAHDGTRADIPAGQIARDGQELNRADWPDLWAKKSAGAVSDAVWLAAPYSSRGKYSSGNGTTTFRMPDTNAKHPDGNTIAAMFLRGDGKNSAGMSGLHQADQLQAFRMEVWGAGGGAASGNFNVSNGYSTSAIGTKTQAEARNFITDGVNGAPRTGTETRGANETVIWCTVGAGKATNPGSVDVTALATTVSQHSGRLDALESSTGFTVLYPNGGTAASPAAIGVNQRYVLTNPFPGFQVRCQVEVLWNNIWADPGFDGNAGTGGLSYGSRASQFFGSGDIALQTGATSPFLGTSSATLGGHGAAVGTVFTTAICRVKVWKLKGATT
jgi:hypothetical protein